MPAMIALPRIPQPTLPPFTYGDICRHPELARVPGVKITLAVDDQTADFRRDVLRMIAAGVGNDEPAAKERYTIRPSLRRRLGAAFGWW